MTVSTALSATLARATTMTPRSRLLEFELAGRPFDFIAGQAVTIAPRGTTVRRTYSIACSPERLRATGRLELLVGIDPQDTLDWARPGVVVDVEGPFGGFTFGDAVPGGHVLFVAGGTGIAPLRAMLDQALRLGPGVHTSLLYSARRSDEFAFIDELRGLADAGRLELHQTVTREDGDTWQGRRGRIGRSEFTSLLHDPLSTLCLICGPGEMVAEAVATLKDLGVPDARIRTEQWGRESGS